MKLGCLFTDSMVFQRNKPIKIWGECESGKTVVGDFRGVTVKTVAENGKFTLFFPSFQAGKGYTLSVKCETEEIVLRDIAVGEVWICGGQSNMEMPLCVTKNGGFALQFVNDDNLRYITVPRQHVKNTPCYGWHFRSVYSDWTPWQVAGGKNGGELSAVAFYFARQLCERENVPVGIIECDWGGTSVYAWISRADLLSDKETYPFAAEHFNRLDGMPKEEYAEELKIYMDDLAETGPKSPMGEGYAFKPISVVSPELYTRYGGLHDTMFAFVRHFAVKGVVWYQGESDCWEKADSKARYLAGFRLLRKAWRRELDDDALPFITTMLANFGSETETTWCEIRDAQLMLACEDAHTYCINNMDNGEKNNIHPHEKRMLGERMAACALAECYGQSVQWKSPIFKSAYRKADGKVYVSFENCFDGLMGDNVDMDGFEIRTNGEWQAAVFTSENGDTVHSKEAFKTADAVRFAQRNYMHIHLYNSLGLPAFPFDEKEISTC